MAGSNIAQCLLCVVGQLSHDLDRSGWGLRPRLTCIATAAKRAGCHDRQLDFNRPARKRSVVAKGVSRVTSIRPVPSDRSDYPLLRTIPTRWSDNDIYGHMNNVVHYSLFDTVVNAFLMERGVLDPHGGDQVFLVVETGCRYFGEMAFPDLITAGIRVARLGTSSVRYEIGLFRNEEAATSAEGFFVHVNIDRRTRRPMPIADTPRSVLESIFRTT
ncbi:MAG: acyl-CoA thioesterase [Rhizobium sp.]|nr:acyl-CoA thioesterase [Rhizobium sp.]